MVRSLDVQSDSRFFSTPFPKPTSVAKVLLPARNEASSRAIRRR